MYTAKQIEQALASTLAKAKADVVEAWTSSEQQPEREALWVEHKAIERLEELVKHEFAAILRRAAGEQ